MIWKIKSKSQFVFVLHTLGLRWVVKETRQDTDMLTLLHRYRLKEERPWIVSVLKYFLSHCTQLQ